MALGISDFQLIPCSTRAPISLASLSPPPPPRQCHAHITSASKASEFHRTDRAAMADGLRLTDGQRQRSFTHRTDTLFSKASDLSKDFGAHVAVVAVSPAGEPRAYGAPTAESVLRTYLPPAAPVSPGAETAGAAAARVAETERETEETKALVEAEWVGLAAACGKIRAAQTKAGLRNWWEVDVEALGEDELPVFIRALEVLSADVQSRIDKMVSARALPWKEKMQK